MGDALFAGLYDDGQGTMALGPFTPGIFGDQGAKELADELRFASTSPGAGSFAGLGSRRGRGGGRGFRFAGRYVVGGDTEQGFHVTGLCRRHEFADVFAGQPGEAGRLGLFVLAPGEIGLAGEDS